jgi:hypothetical protein
LKNKKMIWLVLMLVTVLTAGLMAAITGPSTGKAKQYFIDRGIKYHIGDNRYALSEDKDFVNTYPTVGQVWTQAFTVDQDDYVKVRIQKIWGVDECPYCKIIIAIDDWDMGRLYNEDNHKEFYTPMPLAKKVEPGHTYKLTISSFGETQVDDFVIENVIVETAKANVKFVAQDHYEAPRPKPQEPCADAQRVPAMASAEIAQTSEDFADSGELGRVDPGQELEFDMKMANLAPGGDLVSRPIEILLGDDTGTGWIISFLPGTDRVIHGNVRIRGEYLARQFRSFFQGGKWNRIGIRYCMNNTARLVIDGQAASQAVPATGPRQMVKVRTLGVAASIKPPASGGGADGQPVPEALPAAP